MPAISIGQSINPVTRNRRPIRAVMSEFGYATGSELLARILVSSAMTDALPARTDRRLSAVDRGPPAEWGRPGVRVQTPGLV